MKVLVIQQKMIGDVLTSSLLFEAIKQKYPNSETHYAINTHTYAVVEQNPFIDVFKFITPKIRESKIKFIEFLKEIKNEQYDVVIDVYSKTSSNLISWFSNAKTKISKHKYYTSFIYTHTAVFASVPQTAAGLAIENRWQLLEALGIKPSIEIRPKIFLSPENKKNAKSYLIDKGILLDKPLYMLSVLGSESSKTYPLDYMAMVIDIIIEKKPESQILFNYIPSQKTEADILFSLCKAKTQKRIFIEVFAEDLRTFVSITHFCNAMIGNEGGAVNMAKALEVPTFTIFSPWIKKEVWSLFEDGFKNTAVHLKDYKPEAFRGKSQGVIKSSAEALYQLFLPALFEKKLNQFLNNGHR